MNHTNHLQRPMQCASCAIAIMGLCLTAFMVPAKAEAPQDAFWRALNALCGQAFQGELTVYDEASDGGWIGQAMTIHARECHTSEIRISLNVGENRSRTWVFQRHTDGLALKHDHRHEDGSEDVLTWYGGKTQDQGRPTRQAFVVDGYSQALFYAQGLDVSASNIWYVEIESGQRFAYGLTRPNRHFRAEFDLTQPIDLPPAPWGATDQ